MPTIIVPRVSLLSRTEWGAPATGPEKQPLGPVEQLVVHHTAQGFSYASRASVSGADGKRALAAVRASHVGRDFGDIGYHFLVDGAGRRYQGRAYLAAGRFGPAVTR